MIRKIRLVIALAALGFVGLWTLWKRVEPDPTAPQIAANTALRPMFLLNDGRSFSAGTAVCVRTAPNTKPLMLTALHLFGPSGGLKTDIAPGDLNKQVRAVAATDLNGKQLLVKANGTATHGGYPMTAQGDVSGDVVAFRPTLRLRCCRSRLIRP